MQMINRATGIKVELDECDIAAEREAQSMKQSFPYREGKAKSYNHSTAQTSNASPRTHRRQPRQLDLTKPTLRVGDITFSLPSK